MLADNASLYAVEINIKEAKDIKKIINAISEEIHLTKNEIKIFNQKKSKYSHHNSIILKSNLTDEEVAKVLVQDGFTNLDLIASSSNDDLAQIEGFDEEMAGLLIGRSKEALLTLAMELSSDSDEDSNDLMSLEGVDMSLALELNQKGITDREELAEQSVDELIQLVDMTEEAAAELIMKARAHWFE